MSDDTAVMLMLIAVTVYGLYYLLQIPGAINQLDKLRRNPPRRMIDGKEYVWLSNIVRKVTSLKDPRPDKVIADYKSQGLDVVVLEDAYDIWGKEKCPELRSVWGRHAEGPRRYSDIPY